MEKSPRNHFAQKLLRSEAFAEKIVFLGPQISRTKLMKCKNKVVDASWPWFLDNMLKSSNDKFFPCIVAGPKSMSGRSVDCPKNPCSPQWQQQQRPLSRIGLWPKRHLFSPVQCFCPAFKQIKRWTWESVRMISCQKVQFFQGLNPNAPLLGSLCKSDDFV